MDHPLSSTFSDLASRYTSDQALISTLWQEIKKSYSSPKRYYHNLSHLEYMLNKAFEHQDRIQDFNTLLFAIIYHDIVYKITRKDNELQSAEIAKKRMSEMGVATEKIEKCYRQILATKHNEATDDNDTRYLLDMDMAILGEKTDQYEEYAQKVRKEYALYPDLLYKPGRRNVLQKLLGQERIFQTKDFYHLYERQARENIKRELQKLNG